jgi:hypothetical protein
VRSHLLHLLLYATLVTLFFALLVRRDARERLRLGAVLWLVMVGGALALAYLMYPFPR